MFPLAGLNPGISIWMRDDGSEDDRRDGQGEPAS